MTVLLAQAKALGLLGPGPVTRHVTHAEGFADALGETPGRVLDLGSGGGIPGLVLAARLRDIRLVLLDSGARRCEFLAHAVRRLELADQVEVVHARAEDGGRRPELRALFDAVVARGFGSPAATAECGAAFLRVGGRLIVSEPPVPAARWPPDGLRLLGLEVGTRVGEGTSYQILHQRRRCPDAFPRRSGVPAKRPLF